MTYIEYLEKHLGEIKYGWSKDSSGKIQPYDVVKYNKGPFEGTVTYSTLGLSKIPLKSRMSDKTIRYELFFVAYGSFGDKNIPGILQQVANQNISSGEAYLRGDLLGPKGKLFNGLDLEALYVSTPVYFPETFEVYEDGDTPIVQVWLIPLTKKEAEYIKNNGWSKFEDILELNDPDLIDFTRKSII